MARSLAVLDWKDVQSLVGMCSKTFAKSDPNYETLEQCRRKLIETLFVYLEQWLPGRMIDDDARRPLIKALDDFTVVLRTVVISELVNGSEAPWAVEMNSECSRIKKRLRSALSPPEDTPENGLGIAGT